MTEPDAMDVALADAYREASLAGIDMRVATEQLEHVRGIARDGSLAVEAMIAFSEQIAAAAAVDALCVVLRTLRDAVVDAKLAAEAARLQAATAANPETGHAAWLGAIAHAVGIGTVDLAARFAATPLDPAPSNRDMVLTGIEATRNARWREAVPVLNLLGYESRIPARQRAVVLAMLAEIHWIVREDAAAARACLKEAEALSADNWRVVFSAGRLAEQRPRTDESVANSERLLSRANELAGGRHSGPLLKLGILRRDAGDLAGAAAFFTRATAATVFPADAYTALIELAGDRALFPSRRDQIKSLVRRAELTAIDTGEAYDAMIAAAEAMHTNEIRDGFDRWIERAMAFSPARFTAYLQRGYYNLEAAELDAAEQDFASAVERAPEAPEGWWGRASVAEERRNWPVLLEMATKTLEYAPDWLDAIVERLEPRANGLVAGDLAMARTMYHWLDAAISAADETRLSNPNTAGNIHFFQGDYAKAAHCYRRSLERSPNDGRLHGNLALALERTAGNDPLGNYRQALAAAEKATHLAPAEADLAKSYRRLRCRQTFVERFGPASRSPEGTVDRIRVFLTESLTGLVVVNGALRPEVLARLQGFREGLKQSHHFTLPSVRFIELTGGPADTALQVEVAGRLVLQFRPDEVSVDPPVPWNQALRATNRPGCRPRGDEGDRRVLRPGGARTGGRSVAAEFDDRGVPGHAAAASRHRLPPACRSGTHARACCGGAGSTGAEGCRGSDAAAGGAWFALRLPTALPGCKRRCSRGWASAFRCCHR